MHNFFVICGNVSGPYHNIMKNAQARLLALLIIATSIASCSTGKVTIVDSYPTTIDSATRTVENQGTELKILRYGELDQIRSLDPLFALNPAAQRIVQLVHEGLTGIDENNRVVARIAESWDVTQDSLTYLFTLRDDVFFHDASVFTSGIGRKLTANDVYNTFKRMASNGVPPDASALFVNSIRGYDAFFREQKEIYFEQDRVINDIMGIRVIDDRTIQFNLSNPDAHFLQKLASPLAVIYPVEAYVNKRSAEGGSPVGTGPFRFDRVFGDTLYVLTRNNRYRENQNTTTGIDRIEVINQRVESELFKRFAREEIDFIAELGPQMMRTLINSSGTLEQSYTNSYDLIQSDPQRYEFYFNNRNAYLFSREDALYLIRDFDPSSYRELMGIHTVQIIDTLSKPPVGFVSERLAQLDTVRNVVNVSYNGNLVAGDFLLNLVQHTRQIVPMRIYRTPIVTRELLFYVTQPATFATNGTESNSLDRISHRLMAFTVNRYAIINKNVKGIKFNSQPWWLDLRGVVLQTQPS